MGASLSTNHSLPFQKEPTPCIPKKLQKKTSSHLTKAPTKRLPPAVRTKPTLETRPSNMKGREQARPTGNIRSNGSTSKDLMMEVKEDTRKGQTNRAINLSGKYGVFSMAKLVYRRIIAVEISSWIFVPFTTPSSKSRGAFYKRMEAKLQVAKKTINTLPETNSRKPLKNRPSQHSSSNRFSELLLLVSGRVILGNALEKTINHKENKFWNLRDDIRKFLTPFISRHPSRGISQTVVFKD